MAAASGGETRIFRTRVAIITGKITQPYAIPFGATIGRRTTIFVVAIKDVRRKDTS